MQLIYSEKVWLEARLQAATIVLKDDKIVGIHKGEKKQGAIDYAQLIIMPGVIDVHVHINEPGRTDWEGFETATKAAARGGTTMLVDMPLNSSPVVTTPAALEQKIAASQSKLWVDCGFWAGATNDDANSVAALVKKGCLGVKVFLSDSGLEEFPNISLSHLDSLMAQINQYDVPVLAHCELDTLPASTELEQKPTSYAAYLKSRPKEWENEAVKAFVGLGKKHNCKTHIVHLSSQDPLAELAREKQNFSKLSIETCAHYLLFHAEQIEDGNTLFKCAPPIREQQNNEQLKQALRSGILDFITTDHSPAPAHLKAIDTGDLKKAWGGIAGLQFLLSASWTALKDTLDINEFIPLLTSKPAQFLALDEQIGHIKEGYRANLTIWNPEQAFVVTEETVEHKQKMSPYIGQKLYGQVHSTIVNGSIVFEQEQFINNRKGRCVLRS